jgi:hypothetical protein
MVDAVNVYLRELERYLIGGAEVLVEQDFDLRWLLPDEYTGELPFGRADCIAKSDGSHILVNDYKHGEGVPVYAKNNEQMMFYALGALGGDPPPLRPPVRYPVIRLVVTQPRCGRKENPVDEWELKTTDLFNWGFDVLRPAIVATQEPDAPFKPGKWCRWCKGKTECPEYGKMEAPSMPGGMEIINAKSFFLEEINLDPDKISPEKVAAILNDIHKFKPNINKILRAMDLFQKKATKRVLKKQDVPGYVLAPGRNSNKWRDGPQTLMDLKGLYPDLQFEVSGIKTVPQVKATLKAAGYNADFILSKEIIQIAGPAVIKKAVTADEKFRNALPEDGKLSQISR